MGSLIRIEVIYTDLEEYIRLNPEKAVMASSLDGEDLHEKIRVTGAILLVGNESKGISPALQSLAEKRIRIPRKGGVESLNVAVATGIILSNLELLVKRYGFNRAESFYDEEAGNQ